MLFMLFACITIESKEGMHEGKYTSPLSVQMIGDTSTYRIGPLLKTEWGQDGIWQQSTPTKSGEATYPGCTTVATAQILYYYQHQNYVAEDVCYQLENALEGNDITDNHELCIHFSTEDISYDWEKMAHNDNDSQDKLAETATFLYHVGATLNAQFGGGQGASSTARQIENAFRYQWGYTKRREDQDRSKAATIVLKDQFFPSDEDFAAHLKTELLAGRPVLYMAQQTDSDLGHAFVIDGYDSASNLFHVNWGWGGRANGYYDLSMTDPYGRSWSRDVFIYQYLEPTQGNGAELLPEEDVPIPEYSWNGNGSLISYSSGNREGYGFTKDEALIHPNNQHPPIVFFQWEIDSRDGRKLLLQANEQSHATVTYGLWNDRSADITHRNISLPFVLDPEKDGLALQDQDYIVVSVRFDRSPLDPTIVSAEITDRSGEDSIPVPTEPFLVDGHLWQGNASLISHSSEEKTGYGLDRDEVNIHPHESIPPVSYIQWELSSADGMKLQLSGPAQKASIRYGIWNDRSQDIHHQQVSLPYTIDPHEDGLPVSSGSFLTIAVELEQGLPSPQPLEFKIKK